MKRFFFALLLVILLSASCSFAEEVKCLSIDKLQLGASFIECLDLINREGVEFESGRYEDGQSAIIVHSTTFGEGNHTGHANLRFDDNSKLCQIWFYLDFDYVHEAYAAAYSRFGGADMIYVADYLDNDVGDGYIDSGFPIYIVWKEENLVCELEVYSSFYMDYNSSLFDGITLNADDSLNQSFDFTIYSPELFDERAYLYE